MKKGEMSKEEKGAGAMTPQVVDNDITIKSET